MSKAIKPIIIVLLLVVLGLGGFLLMGKEKTDNKGEENQTVNSTSNNVSNNTINNNVTNDTNNTVTERSEPKDDLSIVPTMQDEITEDGAWCATFQLVWNDMKNEVVKQDVVFNPQEQIAENLNKEEFTEDMLSEEYYYKTYGLKTLELKAQIENGIMEKFNQTSDILDMIDWSEEALNDPNDPNVNRYLFYAMLYREFEFLEEFNELENGNFGNQYTDVKYFGIDSDEDEVKQEKMREQIDVLYYNSEDDFAIIINTKSNDEVILCKNPEGSNFKEMYDNMNNKANLYTGNKEMDDIDQFKAPNLSFNQIREYTELQGKKFDIAGGRIGEIEKAIQSIEFELDAKGGKIKSEAIIDMMDTTSAMPEEIETPRYFFVDDTFAIFLREKGSNLPYFAAKITDITKVQEQ